MLTLLALFACREPAAPDATATRAAPSSTSTPSASQAPPAPDPSSARKGPALLPANSAMTGGWDHYGGEFRLPYEAAIPAEELLRDPAHHLAQTVRVRGRVADVCQDKGCWMVLTPMSGSPEMIRVTMKDHAFSVDKQGHGREADLEGLLIERPVDPETVAHDEGEAGAQGLVPERQSASGQSYELVASAVRFRNPG